VRDITPAAALRGGAAQSEAYIVLFMHRSCETLPSS
jgi:hypothetical protein